MKDQITPCLWFNNQAKEAAIFYKKHFTDSKIVAQSPIVTEIQIAGQQIVLLDGGPMFKPDSSISLFYSCSSEDEVKKLMKGFSKDGSVIEPFGDHPSGGKWAWITDQFGISWQFHSGKEQQAQKIIPCFVFSGELYGNASDAISHYSEVFKDHEKGTIRQDGDKVKSAALTVNGTTLMFMDDAKHNFAFTEGVSLTIYCDNQEEIDYYWEKFTEDGSESMCGWLKDKFGVSWQIIPTILSKLMSDPDKAGRAAKAFMQMRKFDIEKLVQAAI